MLWTNQLSRARLIICLRYILISYLSIYRSHLAMISSGLSSQFSPVHCELSCWSRELTLVKGNNARIRTGTVELVPAKKEAGVAD